jgi:Flp pilus assembly pilin Flp
MRLWAKLSALQPFDQGSSLVEYAVVVSFIALSVIAALRLIGVRVDLNLREFIDALW